MVLLQEILENKGINRKDSCLLVESREKKNGTSFLSINLILSVIAIGTLLVVKPNLVTNPLKMSFIIDNKNLTIQNQAKFDERT